MPHILLHSWDIIDEGRSVPFTRSSDPRRTRSFWLDQFAGSSAIDWLNGFHLSVKPCSRVAATEHWQKDGKKKRISRSAIIQKKINPLATTNGS